jgi:putative ABC transport system permease protein
LVWAALNGVGVGDKVSLTTGLTTHTYTVIGLIKEKSLPGSPPTAWLPLQTLQAAFDVPGAASSVYLQLQPNQSLPAAREAIQAALGAQYFLLSAADKPPSGNLLTQALQLASVALLFSAGFFVFNAYAITLTERRRAIGQLRALGMTRAQVLIQTLTESGLTALIGCFMGLFLGWLLGWGLLGTSVYRIPLPA